MSKPTNGNNMKKSHFRNEINTKGISMKDPKVFPVITVSFSEMKEVGTFPVMKRIKREREMGGLLILLIKSRFRITALNLLPVLLTRNRYSCVNKYINDFQNDDLHI